MKKLQGLISSAKRIATVMAFAAFFTHAIADCKNSTLVIYWDTSSGQLITDNLDGCMDALVIVPSGANDYYVGGQFGYSYGLKTDLSPNQSIIRALSVVRAHVDPTTHAVTCYGLTVNAGGTPGVTGYDQIVYAIALSDNGDVYVGGDFYTSANNSYSENIGCYQASGGWGSRIFTVYGSFAQTVNFLSYDSSTKKLLVEGNFNSVSGPAHYACDTTTYTLTGLPNYVYWQTYNGSFGCGYWTPN